MIVDVAIIVHRVFVIIIIIFHSRPCSSSSRCCWVVIQIYNNMVTNIFHPQWRTSINNTT